MENAGRLDDYLVLLKIRLKAYRRNLFLAVGLFLMTIFAAIAMTLLTEWDERSIWIMGVFVVLFIVNFLMAWARFEITRENIELVNHLQVQS